VNEIRDEDLYNETIHAFLRLHRYLRRYSRRIRDEGISGRKMSALRLLAESGPKTIGQLGEYLAIGDSTTSEMVTQLAALGYVTRVRSASDQRVVHVDLSAAGRSFADQAPLGGIPLLRERLRSLPRERLTTVCDTLLLLQDLLGIDQS
jgi:DNA-binding MarR family transcriptional regulator